MDEINKETLHRLHQVQLECMDEIHRFCERNEISYFLDSGSALGGVRHSGFIPWDDDIDIGMMRGDYEKFLQIAPSQLDEKYFIQTNESEPNYTNFHAKIRIEGTFYPQEYTVNFKHRGIQIDLFPFDYLPGDYGKAIRYIHKARLKRRLSDIKSGNQTTPNPIKKVMFFIIKMFPKSFYRKLFEKHCRRFNGKTTKYVTCFSYKMSRTMDLVFNVEDIVPVKPIPFEGRVYNIVNNVDAYLSEMFGDYMTLPPEDKRVCHVNGDIIFDTNI